LTATNIPSLSADAAIALVQAAVAEAVRQGLRIAVCACDAQGHDLAAVRMDGVTPPILGFARDKAYTAATMRRTTAAFAERMGASQSLSLGLSTRPRLLPWGGGVPVVMDGQVIGGLGVSGATDAEDVACAEAALVAFGLGWQV
jgi:uncharacterized protein GlcG (DUF336 family)